MALQFSYPDLTEHPAFDGHEKILMAEDLAIGLIQPYIIRAAAPRAVAAVIGQAISMIMMRLMMCCACLKA